MSGRPNLNIWWGVLAAFLGGKKMTGKIRLGIVLVLAIAPLANALTLSLSADSTDVLPGQTYTISVISDTGGLAGNYWTHLRMEKTVPATLSRPLGFLPQDLIIIQLWPDPIIYDWELVAYDSEGRVPAGVHFISDLIIDQGATVGTQWDIWLTVPNDATYTPGSALTFTVVPEPTTVLLLGFGGLLLRKRRLTLIPQ